MTEKVFDRDGVMARLDGDQELFQELLQVFEEEWPKLVAEVEAGLSSGDAAGVTLHAHSLKGALGNVGAAQASAAARELEFCGKEARLADGGRLLTAMVAAINEYRSAVRAAGFTIGDGST